MKRIANIFNDLLAEFPVIGPHYGLETELLLAGKKPVGWFFLFQKDEIAVLDKAVSEGKLLSLDIIEPQTNETHQPQTIRFYCQPDKKADMIKAADIESGKLNYPSYDYAHLYGYRKRDICFFSLTSFSFLPESLRLQWHKLRNNINEPIQAAYQGRLSRELQQTTPSKDNDYSIHTHDS